MHDFCIIIIITNTFILFPQAYLYLDGSSSAHRRSDSQMVCIRRKTVVNFCEPTEHGGVFRGAYRVISRDDIGKLQIKTFNILDKIYDGYDEDFPISVNPRESRFPTEDDLYTLSPMLARY